MIAQERKTALLNAMQKLEAYRQIQNEMGRAVAAFNFRQADRLLSFFALDREDVSLEYADEGVFNDIAITEENSSYISRKHCTLELDYDIGSWVIRDGQWDRYETGGWKRSTNGTYVNSTEVSMNGMAFVPGDIISIGDTKLRAEAY